MVSAKVGGVAAVRFHCRTVLSRDAEKSKSLLAKTMARTYGEQGGQLLQAGTAR